MEYNLPDIIKEYAKNIHDISSYKQFLVKPQLDEIQHMVDLGLATVQVLEERDKDGSLANSVEELHNGMKKFYEKINEWPFLDIKRPEILTNYRIVLNKVSNVKENLSTNDVSLDDKVVPYDISTIEWEGSILVLGNSKKEIDYSTLDLAKHFLDKASPRLYPNDSLVPVPEEILKKNS